MKTRKYIRTQYGTFDYKTTARMFSSVVNQSATAFEVKALWEILRVAFQETGSEAPASLADDLEPEVVVEDWSDEG